MKRSILSLLAILLILPAISLGVALSENSANGTKKFVLRPGTSGYLEIEWTYFSQMNIVTKADQGRAYIKVLNGKGRTVARGVGRVSFRSSKKRTSYKIVVTNKTKKLQKVTTSWGWKVEKGLN